MPTIELPQGKVNYRVAGPEDSTRPPVVFVHGFLVSATLWTKTADLLAESGVRSYAPDWPMASHTIPIGDKAEQSPRGIARQIINFLDALDLKDVTLVGNDSGGAMSQFVLDTDASRINRLVLTNCDSFENFPPFPFDLLFKSFRRTSWIRAVMAPMRSTGVRHSFGGYGLLVKKPLDAAQTRAWVEPCINDAAIRQDASRLVRSLEADEMVGVSNRMNQFGGKVLLVWGNGDRFFKIQQGRRLENTFRDARLVEIEGGRTFVPLDEPERLAAEMDAFIPA